MTINLIINVIICLLTIISSSLSGKAVHNNKKIKSKLNLIEKRIIKKTNLNKNQNDVDVIKELFIEFENKFRSILEESE